MAWAEKMTSGNWRGNYRVGGRVRSAGTFPRKRDAVAAAAAKEDEQRKPGAIDPRSGKLTWGAWVDQTWWDRRRVEDSTKARDKSRLEHRLRPQWGHRELGSITRAEVDDWILDLSARDDLSAATITRIYHLFSASMTAAVTARKIETTPCVKIELPHAPLPDEHFLTRDEVDALVWAMPKGLYKTLVSVAAGTGLRWGELAAMHWQRVHTGDGPRVDVAIAWDTKNLIYKTPKDREKRSVPITEDLAADLDEHAKSYPYGDQCAKPHPNRLRSPCESALVLPGRFAGPLHYNTFLSGVWHPACKRAKIRATPHSLRHSYASWLLQDGVPMEQVAELLGHASILTTRRYAKFAQSRWDSVREALARRPTGPRSVPDADSG